MGYTTYFSGEIEVEPPLSAALVAEINAYNREEHRGTALNQRWAGGAAGRDHDRNVTAPSLHFVTSVGVLCGK